MHTHEASEFIAGIGKATHCTASKGHVPNPMRFVFHHILPRACGGQTVTKNLAAVCDNCHMSAHRMLFALAQHDGVLPKSMSHLKGTGRYQLAQQGYAAAVAAGTVAQIPNEGQAPE